MTPNYSLDFSNKSLPKPMKGVDSLKARLQMAGFKPKARDPTGLEELLNKISEFAGPISDTDSKNCFGWGLLLATTYQWQKLTSPT